MAEDETERSLASRCKDGEEGCGDEEIRSEEEGVGSLTMSFMYKRGEEREVTGVEKDLDGAEGSKASPSAS